MKRLGLVYALVAMLVALLPTGSPQPTHALTQTPSHTPVPTTPTATPAPDAPPVGSVQAFCGGQLQGATTDAAARTRPDPAAAVREVQQVQAVHTALWRPDAAARDVVTVAARVANTVRSFLPVVANFPTLTPTATPIDLSVSVVPTDGIAARTTPPGSQVTYTLRLVNTGSTTLSVELRFTALCGAGIPGCIESFEGSSRLDNITPGEGRNFNVLVQVPADAQPGQQGVTAVTVNAAAPIVQENLATVDLTTSVQAPTPTNTPVPTATPRPPDPDPANVKIDMNGSRTTVGRNGFIVYNLDLRNDGRGDSGQISFQLPYNRSAIRFADTRFDSNKDWVTNDGSQNGVAEISFSNLRGRSSRGAELCFQVRSYTPDGSIIRSRGFFTWSGEGSRSRETNQVQFQVFGVGLARDPASGSAWAWLAVAPTRDGYTLTGDGFAPGETVRVWQSLPTTVQPLAVTATASDAGSVVVRLDTATIGDDEQAVILRGDTSGHTAVGLLTRP